MDAEEIAISGNKTIKESVTCSPILTAHSMGELESKLKSWKKENCQAQVEIRNSTAGNFGGCSILSFGAQSVMSNSKDFVIAKVDDPEFCIGGQGRTYGALQCRN